MMHALADAVHWLLEEGVGSHGICLVLDPWALKWGGFGQFSVAAAYVLALPPMLGWTFVRASVTGREVVFSKRPWAFLLFAGFILLCGIGHVVMYVDYFRAFYRLEAVLHVATGAVSWATVGLLPFMVSVEERVPLATARELWHEHANLILLYRALGAEYAALAAAHPTERGRAVAASLHPVEMPKRDWGPAPRVS